MPEYQYWKRNIVFGGIAFFLILLVSLLFAAGFFCIMNYGIGYFLPEVKVSFWGLEIVCFVALCLHVILYKQGI